MNFTVSPFDVNFGAQYPVPGWFRVALSVALVGGYNASSVAKRVGQVFSLFSSGFSYLNGQAQRRAPLVVKAVAITGNLLQAAGITFDEMADFANFGGTKDPLASIAKSKQRIEQHHAPFGECCEFLAEQAAQFYLKKRKQFEGMASETVKNFVPLSFLGGAVEWVMGFNQELIAQTIEATILHGLANLTEEGFDPQHTFQDQRQNPLGRILSVLGECFTKYQARFAQIQALPTNQQGDQYRALFQTISNELLAKLFPKGAADIQIFHHTIPVRLVKEQIWKEIQNQLPIWLERLYFETPSVSKEHPNWEANFDTEANGLKVSQILPLPTHLLQFFIRKNEGRLLDEQIPLVERVLTKMGISQASHFSPLLVQFVKEFLLSEDPVVKKVASFFETYGMERLLYNLSNYVPDDVNVDLPYYLLKQCVGGNPFKLLYGGLTANTEEVDRAKKRIVKDLLAPFGLDRQGTFPLPPTLKSFVWPFIQKFIRDDLAQLLAIPKWNVLLDARKNQRKIEAWIEDQSLIPILHNLIKTLLESAIAKVADPEFSPTNSLSAFLSLTDDQQKQLDGQLRSFVSNEPTCINLLKAFAQELSEALILQLCTDTYESYLCDISHEGLQELFESNEEANNLTLSAWLVNKVSDAFELLNVQRMDDNEKLLLKKAIQLKNSAAYDKNPLTKKKTLEELDLLWPQLEPRFKHLLNGLLSIFGYTHYSKLPVPEPLQQMCGKMLDERGPQLLFQHASDFLLPILDKETLIDQIDQLPHGELISQGCALLAEDIFDHAPQMGIDHLDDIFEMMPVKLSDQIKQILIHEMQPLLAQENSLYDPLWSGLEQLSEAIFLKVASLLSQLKKDDLITIKQAWLEMRSLQQGDQKALMKVFIDRLFELLKIKEEDLYAVPPVFRKWLLTFAKQKMAQGLLIAVGGIERMGQLKANQDDLGEDFSPTKISQAILASTRYSIDNGTDRLDSKIVKLYAPTTKWLDERAEKGYQLAELFKTVFEQEIPNPFLEMVAKWLNDPQATSYKEVLTNICNPLLTKKVMECLAPLLEMEKEGQAKFDQTLLMALLPLIQQHLQHLNQASQKEGGLTLENFLEAAGTDIHPAITDDKQKELFYQKQVELIFKLVVSDEDIKAIFPDVEIPPFAFKTAKKLLAGLLPATLDSLLDKENLVEFFNQLFENMLESLDEPIVIKSSHSKPLTKEEKERETKMDLMIGDFILEAARFIDFPLDRFQKLPYFKKELSQTVGAAVRDQFDGQLLAHTIRQTLPKLAAKQYIKLTEKEEQEVVEKAPEHLKELEKQMIEKGLAYAVRWVGAYIEHTTNIFGKSILNSVREAIFRVASFMIMRLLGSLIRFCRLDRLLVNLLYRWVDFGVEKAISVLSQADIQKNLIYHGVEALEGVLAASVPTVPSLAETPEETPQVEEKEEKEVSIIITAADREIIQSSNILLKKIKRNKPGELKDYLTLTNQLEEGRDKLQTYISGNENIHPKIRQSIKKMIKGYGDQKSALDQELCAQVKKQFKPNLKIPIDGNCLFTSVDDLLKENKGQQHYRKLAASYIREHAKEYEQDVNDALLHFEGEAKRLFDQYELSQGGRKEWEAKLEKGLSHPATTVDIYCDCLENSATWGGLLDMQALSEKLQATILVFTPHDKKSWRIELMYGRTHYPDKLLMIYYNGVDHFENLIPI